MLKPNEISKGSWVNWFNSHYSQYSPRMVYGVLDGYVYFSEDEDTEPYMRDRQELGVVNPLHLSLDIIIKIFSVYSDESRSAVIGNMMISHNEGLGGSSWHVFYKGKGITGVDNVHQLQNLYFSLTGTELKIKF